MDPDHIVSLFRAAALRGKLELAQLIVDDTIAAALELDGKQAGELSQCSQKLAEVRIWLRVWEGHLEENLRRAQA